MFRGTDILTAVKSALAAYPTFASADIYKRQPIDEDYDRSKVNVFLWLDTVARDTTPIVQDFRTYRVNVQMKFFEEGRSRSTTATDTVSETKHELSDACQDALRACLPAGDYPIADCYHCEFDSSDLYADEDGQPYDSLQGKEYNVLHTWNFYTYEQPNATRLTDGGYFLITESNEYLTEF